MLPMTAAICSLLAAGPALSADPCSDPMCADEGFGASGRVAVDFAYSDADRGNAVVRVPGQDRIYVIGQVSTVVAGRVVGPNETLDFGVLRVWSHQIFADGFEAWGSAAEWDSITTAP